MTNALRLAVEENIEPTVKIYVSRVSPKILKLSHAYCATIAKSHYENFPVASLLLPKHIRPAVQAVYAFARLADDFADEGVYHGRRMVMLNQWEDFLKDFKTPTHPIFIALHDTISRYLLPKALFRDLLMAFKMDVTKKRYENFDEVLTYCKLSANPIGRLVLHLFGEIQKEFFTQSDHICTALQLTNHWQDVAIDLQKDRIYLPQDDLEKFGVSEQQLFAHTADENFKRLMMFEVDRVSEIFVKGKPLGLKLKGRLGLEMRLTWLAGVTVLKKIKAVGYDIFRRRPKITKGDLLKLFAIALNRRLYASFHL